jgi:rifampicin phosphotransferase
MIGDVYIKLGSGRAEKQFAGNKGRLLDQAAQTGLNVPRGVLVLDTAWDQAILRGLMTITEGRVRIPDARKLITFLDLPKFERPLAIRSAFSKEDTAEASLAGYFESVLRVPADDSTAQAEAIKQVLESAERYEGRFRRDMLIMEMVDAKHAGVAFTEREHEDDLINYTEGTAEHLVSSEEAGDSFPLAKLHGTETNLKDTDHLWQRRLQNMLKGVRRWLGNKNWDIEWADDGERCYLVQLRPITQPTRRNEAFTIANHKEILPELPSTFMTSVVESCAKDLFQYYRNFDPSLPSTRPFIEVFYGRPYINLSLMSEMMRIFGLPTRLVTDNIGGETDRVYGLNLKRMARKIIRWNLPRFAFAQINSVRHVHATTATMHDKTTNLPQSFSGLTESMRWLYTALVTEMFSLTAAIGPMLSLLRGFGTLNEHNARNETISSKMYADMAPLRDIVARHAGMLPVLEAGEIPEDAAFKAAWADYIATYGHRGIYESDIARPRYKDDPTPLLQSLTTPTGKRQPTPPRTFKGWLTQPLWWQAGRTIRAREQWRHDAMIGFARIRDAMVTLAQEKVAAGVLPDVDSLWMLTVDEVKSLDVDWVPDAAFWEDRRAEIERLRGYHLPDLFRRFDDLEATHDDADTTQDNSLQGIGLTTGTVTGQAWVLREPALTTPPHFEHTVLIARSVDAGWIATFGRVAGVVVETGGDLSHGSIILREIGLPAVTNVSHATRHIQTGDTVRIDAQRGLVKVLERVDPTGSHTKEEEKEVTV